MALPSDLESLVKRLAVLLLASAAFAQEPIKFRRAYIGEPLSDFADNSSGKEGKLQSDYKKHGKLCEGKRGSVGRVKLHAGFLGSAKGDGQVFLFEDRKLISIKVLVPNEDWERVKHDVSRKLGAPLSEVPQVYKNGFGASWDYDQGFWQKEGLVD